MANQWFNWFLDFLPLGALFASEFLMKKEENILTLYVIRISGPLKTFNSTNDVQISQAVKNAH